MGTSEKTHCLAQLLVRGQCPVSGGCYFWRVCWVKDSGPNQV